MFLLTREVRFAIGLEPADGSLRVRPAPDGPNPFAARPRLDGLGLFFIVRVALAGVPDPTSQYVRNIQEMDRAVRSAGEPVLRTAIAAGTFGGGGRAVIALVEAIKSALPGGDVRGVDLLLSPFLALGWRHTEPNMIRLSQRFEFSAAHRLHNSMIDDDANLRTFGKCNNPLGHGHNYELQVTVTGEPDGNGVVMGVGELERIVHEQVISRFDHKHLNAEVPEFADVIPSVENIARVTHGLLKARIPGNARLASVTVWETPKTWCEYSE